MPEPLQRVLDAGGRAQRHLPLERAPALEDGDTAHAVRRRSCDDVGRRGARPSAGRDLPGEGRVEADLLRDDLADPSDALTDRVLVDPRVVQAHRRAAAAVEERCPAGHEGDVVPQPAREEVGGVDVVGQRRPDEQAALRLRPGRLRRQVLGQGLEHHVAAPAVEGHEVAQVPPPVTRCEEARHEVLGQRRGAQVRALLAEVHLRQHGPRRGGPAETQPGGEDLREGPEVDDVVTAVQRPQRGHRIALEADEAVRVVLQDQQLPLARDGHEAPAPLHGHGDARRVLEGRDGVDELRLAALGVEAGELRFEHVDAHAVVVHLDLDGPRPGRRRRSESHPGTSAPPRGSRHRGRSASCRRGR